MVDRRRAPFKVWPVVLVAGLVFFFQNCGGLKGFDSIGLGSQVSTRDNLSETCSPGQWLSCSINNGAGAMLCGAAAGTCLANSCDSGYLLTNSVCVSVACVGGSVSQCTTAVGSGTKSCKADGSGFGDCVLNSCVAGYSLTAGGCAPSLCVAGGSQGCSNSHGSGTQTCGSSGTWGQCLLNACESGYSLTGGSCVANSCNPGSNKNCSVGSGAGVSTCSVQGTWGACLISSCAVGSTLQNGICVLNACSPSSQQSCRANNGLGVQRCVTDGLKWEACVLAACDPGYYLSAGQCFAQICGPNEKKACSAGGGSGFASCNATGTGYGSCTISTCDPGYTLVGGSSCVPNGAGKVNVGTSQRISGRYVGTLNVDTPKPNLTGSIPVGTGVCGVNAEVNLGHSSAPSVPDQRQIYPTLNLFNLYQNGTFNFFINISSVGGVGKGALLAIGGKFNQIAGCPVVGFQNSDILLVNADLTITGSLNIKGLMVVEPGVTLIVGEGKIGLGTDGQNAGVLWLKQGAKLILNNDEVDSVGDKAGGGFGLVILNGAILQAGSLP